MKVTMTKRIEQFKKQMQPVETIANDVRDIMIKERHQETAKQPSKKVANLVQQYFKDNDAIPGEGSLRAMAGAVLDPNPNPVTSVSEELGQGSTREERRRNGRQILKKKMAQDYATTCIKQFEPQGVNTDVITNKMWESMCRDGMIYTTEKGSTCIKCLAYEGKLIIPNVDPRYDRTIGYIDESFMEAHRATDKRRTSLVLEGNKAQAIIDLGSDGYDLELDLALDRPEPEQTNGNDKTLEEALKELEDGKPKPKQFLMTPDEDDFTKAVGEIPAEPKDPGLQI